MARTRRLLVVAAAWAIPIAWIAVALLSGPSDGTMISPSGAMLGADRWGETVTVVHTYGDTPLREGDVISRVDDVPIGEWVDGRPASSRAVGEVVRYEVLRPGRSWTSAASSRCHSSATRSPTRRTTTS